MDEEAKLLNEALERCYRIAMLEDVGGKKTLDRKIIKLQEEAGEFAAAYLMSVGSKGTKKTSEQITDNLLEEGCDVMLVVLSILMRSGFDMNDVIAKFQKKMDKWERQVKK